MTDRVREEFEAWANGQGGIGRTYRDSTPGSSSYYEDSHTELAWRSWQASRASLVIELPDNRSLNFDECAVRAKDQCAKAIEAAGVKVK